RLLERRRRLAQLVGERADVRRPDRPALHRVLPARAHHDVDLVGALELLVGVGRREVDLELGLPRVRRREHQEEDDHEEPVDHRDQVDLRVVLGGAREPHGSTASDSRWKRSPWTTSTSRAACCSISTTKPSTLPRKCRKKIMAGIAITRPKPVLYKATEMPCASSIGLEPLGVCDPNISIMPTTVPNSPISGLIVAIVPR